MLERSHTQSGAFEQYNGCKWRGSTLRLEVARPAYAARLSEEWSKDNAEPSHHDTTEIYTISEPAHELSQPGGFVALNILRPDGSKVHHAMAVPGLYIENRHSVYFSWTILHIQTHTMSCNDED